MKAVQQESDLVLVEAAIDGNAESFTELCRRYYPAMVAIAHSVLGDRHLSEDAAQQAFAKAAVKLPELKNKSRFGVWLATVCRNAARDVARTTERASMGLDLSAIPAAAKQDNGASEAVEEALRELAAPAREVVFLRFYDGLSYEQISAVLGISEQAINGRLRRAKRRMAGCLRRQGFGRVRS